MVRGMNIRVFAALLLAAALLVASLPDTCAAEAYRPSSGAVASSGSCARVMHLSSAGISAPDIARTAIAAPAVLSAVPSFGSVVRSGTFGPPAGDGTALPFGDSFGERLRI